MGITLCLRWWRGKWSLKFKKTTTRLKPNADQKPDSPFWLQLLPVRHFLRPMAGLVNLKKNGWWIRSAGDKNSKIWEKSWRLTQPSSGVKGPRRDKSSELWTKVELCLSCSASPHRHSARARKQLRSETSTSVPTWTTLRVQEGIQALSTLWTLGILKRYFVCCLFFFFFYEIDGFWKITIC